MKTINFFIYIPLIILDLLLSKIFNYIPKLNFFYKINASKIDNDRSIGYHKLICSSFKQIKLKDIHNKKLRWSLILTFKKWYIYQLDKSINKTSNVSDNERYRIYISRDKLTKESLISGERISDFSLSKNYSSKKFRLFLKSKGLERNEFYKIEPQLYVICAVKNDKRYNKMQEKREIRYKKNRQRKLTKHIKKAIKNDNLYCRVSSWQSNTPLNLAVEANRYDLIDKILEYAESIDEREKVINYSYYWDEPRDAKTPIQMAKNDEMREYLIKNGAKNLENKE